MARTFDTKDLKLDNEHFGMLVWLQEKEKDVYPIQRLRKLIRDAATQAGYQTGGQDDSAPVGSNGRVRGSRRKLA